jgi:hypothetical protein
MTRPTASSERRVHEKSEVKSPPRRAAAAALPKKSVAPKMNGVAKPVSKSGTVSKEVDGAAEGTGVDGAAESADETTADIPPPAQESESGIETPVPNAEHAGEGALENTPAFAEEGIR